MHKKQIFNILLIFTTVIILVTVGLVLTLIWKNARSGEEEITYNLLFGNLHTPITENMGSTISTTLQADTSELTTSNNVYKIDASNKYYPSKSLGDSLAESLNLNLTLAEDDIYLYDNEEGNTSLELYNDIKSLTLNFFKESPQNAAPLEKDAEIIAKAKLEEINLWPYESDEDHNVSYRYYFIAGNNYYETTTNENASLTGVNFTSTINNIPVIISRINSGEIEVLVNSNKEIIKISYTYHPASKEITGTYPIKSAQTASIQIGKKKAELITVFGSEYPKSLTINNVAFAYRIEYKDQQYLQPIYVFEGLDNNDNITTIIVPAIEDQYLIMTDDQ